jgi:hypothetical protein
MGMILVSGEGAWQAKMIIVKLKMINDLADSKSPAAREAIVL